jgi:hypothetical protein
MKTHPQPPAAQDLTLDVSAVTNTQMRIPTPTPREENDGASNLIGGDAEHPDGTIGFRKSIQKIKEIKRLKGWVKRIDIANCCMVIVNVVASIYIVRIYSVKIKHIYFEGSHIFQLYSE